MVSNSPALILRRLEQKLRSLETTRKSVESAVAAGSLTEAAAEEVHQGLLLSAHTFFEIFLEGLFIGLLVRGRGGMTLPRCKPRLSIQSASVAREVVLGPKRKWIDWMPYERTIDLAHVFFRGGRPFTDLPKPDVEILERISVLRNAVAHRSRHSIEKYRRVVIGPTPLPPRQRSPGGFLRGQLSFAPVQTRYESYYSHLLKVARNLAR